MLNRIIYSFILLALTVTTVYALDVTIVRRTSEFDFTIEEGIVTYLNINGSGVTLHYFPNDRIFKDGFE